MGLALGALVSFALAATAAVPHFDHSHAAWTAVLAEHVHAGEVDYTGLHADGAALDGYLKTLAAVDQAEYRRWSSDESLAFWINAYNAYTVKLILMHWPVQSIKDIGSLLKGPWKQAFIPMQRLRGATITLDSVEHEILRPEFAEPRIHFAIVCASRSCPKLRAEAYRAGDLDRQLTGAAQGFLRDPMLNGWNPATRTLSLSPIFKWFRGDFDKAAGSLAGFVAPFMAPAAAREIGGLPPPTIEFRDYDWSLNGR